MTTPEAEDAALAWADGRKAIPYYEAHAHAKTLAAGLRKARAEADEAKQKLARFMADYINGKPGVVESFCFFCGTGYATGLEAEKKHLAYCAKHPLRAAESQVAGLVAGLKDILAHAEPHQYETGAIARGFLQVVVAKASALLASRKRNPTTEKSK